MPARFASFRRLVQDPPPEFVFEISTDSVRMARSADAQTIRTEPLPPGVISPSPLHENIALIEPLNDAVARLAPRAKGGKRRTAAVLLPDHCAHVAVLDFDGFPERAEDQLSLVRFRLKRSVPFDVESAALSYWPQDSGASAGGKNRREVVVAVTALGIISRYEAPFRAADLQPGLVSLSSLASMDLIEPKGIVAVARLSGHVLTVLVRKEAVLKVVRSIELAGVSLPEIASHLHQTFVYAEDNAGGSPEVLLLAGFGLVQSDALREFPEEFGVPVHVLGAEDTGIRGYLKGVAA